MNDKPICKVRMFSPQVKKLMKDIPVPQGAQTSIDLSRVKILDAPIIKIQAKYLTPLRIMPKKLIQESLDKPQNHDSTSAESLSVEDLREKIRRTIYGQKEQLKRRLTGEYSSNKQILLQKIKESRLRAINVKDVQ